MLVIFLDESGNHRFKRELFGRDDLVLHSAARLVTRIGRSLRANYAGAVETITVRDS